VIHTWVGYSIRVASLTASATVTLLFFVLWKIRPQPQERRCPCYLHLTGCYGPPRCGMADQSNRLDLDICILQS
jgi:hypothetical protein